MVPKAGLEPAARHGPYRASKRLISLISNVADIPGGDQIRITYRTTTLLIRSLTFNPRYSDNNQATHQASACGTIASLIIFLSRSYNCFPKVCIDLAHEKADCCNLASVVEILFVA